MELEQLSMSNNNAKNWSIWSFKNGNKVRNGTEARNKRNRQDYLTNYDRL